MTQENFDKTVKRGIVSEINVFHGVNMELFGLQGKGLLLSSMRVLIDGFGPNLQASLVTVEGGLALRVRLGIHGDRGLYWLVSESSQQLRIFKRADTALAQCHDLGLNRISVDLIPLSLTLIRSEVAA